MIRLIPTLLFVFLVVQVQVINGAKPRFAPKYCLRFKFDCTSPEKKGHVCCLFPLPIEGNDLGEQSSVRESAPSVSIGVRKIRPLRLPSRRNGDESNVGQEHSSGNNRYDVFNQQKKEVKTETKKPSNTQKRKEAAKKKATTRRTKPTNTNSTPKRTSVRPKRPIICRRLVVNCRKNAKHTCCKFQQEKKPDDKEDTTKANDENNETDVEVTTVETTEDIKTVEVSNSPTEETTKPVDTTPEIEVDQLEVKKPVTPVLTNNIVKQKLDASVIPSSKRKIQFKNIQLNSRERTRLANKRKPPSKPIATIEAVPLDLVEIKISPNKRKIPDVNNDLGKNQLEQSKESDSLPPLQIFPNHTSSNSDQVPLVELPLPDTKPYKRIAAECFTMTFDCKTSPSHMCCPYHS